MGSSKISDTHKFKKEQRDMYHKIAVRASVEGSRAQQAGDHAASIAKKEQAKNFVNKKNRVDKKLRDGT